MFKVSDKVVALISYKKAFTGWEGLREIKEKRMYSIYTINDEYVMLTNDLGDLIGPFEIKEVANKLRVCNDVQAG